MVDIQAKLKEIGPFVEGPDDDLLVGAEGVVSEISF